MMKIALFISNRAKANSQAFCLQVADVGFSFPYKYLDTALHNCKHSKVHDSVNIINRYDILRVF